MFISFNNTHHNLTLISLLLWHLLSMRIGPYVCSPLHLLCLATQQIHITWKSKHYTRVFLSQSAHALYNSPHLNLNKLPELHTSLFYFKLLLKFKI